MVKYYLVGSFQDRTFSHACCTLICRQEVAFPWLSPPLNLNRNSPCEYLSPHRPPFGTLVFPPFLHTTEQLHLSRCTNPTNGEQKSTSRSLCKASLIMRAIFSPSTKTPAKQQEAVTSTYCDGRNKHATLKRLGNSSLCHLQD